VPRYHLAPERPFPAAEYPTIKPAVLPAPSAALPVRSAAMLPDATARTAIAAPKAPGIRGRAPQLRSSQGIRGETAEFSCNRTMKAMLA
jgi:hypothetical protein